MTFDPLSILACWDIEYERAARPRAPAAGQEIGNLVETDRELLKGA